MKLSLIVIVCLALTSCATVEEQEREKRVQVFQQGDPDLACGQLKVQVSQLDTDIVWLNTKIDGGKAAGGAFIPPGQFAGMMQMIAQTSASEAQQLQPARDTRQQRRDILMKQYFAKRC